MLTKILYMLMIMVLSFSSPMAAEKPNAHDHQIDSTGVTKLITIIKPDNTKIMWEVNIKQKLSDLKLDLVRANIINPGDIIFQKDGSSIVQDLSIGKVVDDGFLTIIHGGEVVGDARQYLPRVGGFVKDLLSDAKFWVTTAVCLNGITVRNMLHAIDIYYCKQAGQCSPFPSYPVDRYIGWRDERLSCTPQVYTYPCDEQTMFLCNLASDAMILAPVLYTSAKILYKFVTR